MTIKSLDDNVQFTRGVGPKMALEFKNIGIETVYDLLYYPPFRYINRNITEKSEYKDKSYITVVGEIEDTGETFTRSRKYLFSAIVKSGSDYFYARWFNNKYVSECLHKGDIAVLSGRVDVKKGVYELMHPEYEKFPEEDVELLHTGRTVPVYHLAGNLSQKYLRKIIKHTIDEVYPFIEEDLPNQLIDEKCLLNLKESIMNIHYPSNNELFERAIHRMKYSELFYVGIITAIKREKNRIAGEFNYAEKSILTETLLKKVGFELTVDQNNAVKEILSDMKSLYPMNRLLMGDVGVGKTIVALIAMLHAAESGYQTVIMAPTEVLAQQHYIKIKDLTEGLGVDVELITSSVKKENRRLNKISDGSIGIVIGTHALIEDDVIFKNLKLVIVDEQHRFGVLHRSSLKAKGYNPDYLVMTATPIPRSLSMAVYGEMELTEIKNRPKMQKEIKTKWIAHSEIGKMYDFIKKHIDSRERVFIVCPAIEENPESELESVEKIYGSLTKHELKGVKVGLIHSKLPQKEKDLVMHRLKNGDIDVLIGTTVIEVGIDVKEATVMVILNAERFGLSQLHQLRGRVGRGEMQSYCFLVSGKKITEEGINRLKTIASTSDGFKISEMDMKMRGAGELWGSKQHGIPRFKFADYFEDFQMMKDVFSDAAKIIADDRDLLKLDNRCVKMNIKRRFSDEID